MKTFKHNKRNTRTRGSVTIYLSISFTLLLSLIVYTIESCHLDAMVARSEAVTYISLDSLFGQYCLPLFEKFGLFCLNEQGLDLKSELTKYAEENCKPPAFLLTNSHSFLRLNTENVDITKVEYITDTDGELFSEQICDYISYLKMSDLAKALMDDASTEYPDAFKDDENGNLDLSLDNIDTGGLIAYANKIESSNSENSNADNEVSREQSDTSNIDAETFEDSISDSIGHIIKNGLLSFIVNDPSKVSSNSVDKATLPSVTCQLSQDGVNASYGYYKDHADATFKKACVCEYVENTFGSYTNPDINSKLNYSMEYVIYGSDSDDVNFINCCLQLIALRTGLNLVHILTDKNKCNALEQIASITESLPIVRTIAKYTIMTIWATAEAILDIRDLVSGKSVPLIKTSDQWNLSLEGLKDFSKTTTSKNAGTTGLSYERYLQMLMLLQNNISVYYRTMDLIQMDICANYNEDFRLSKCVTSIEASIEYRIPFILLPRSENYTSNGYFSYR